MTRGTELWGGGTNHCVIKYAEKREGNDHTNSDKDGCFDVFCDLEPHWIRVGDRSWAFNLM